MAQTSAFGGSPSGAPVSVTSSFTGVLPSMTVGASKLTQLVEPIFVYICRLNRSIRQNVQHTPQSVRNDLQTLLADMQAKSQAHPLLAQSFQKVRLPLVFFVDNVVRNSTLPFAMEWADLAAEEDELAGDEKFFVLLDDTLAEKGEDADERINVFLTCIGLGFTGILVTDPPALQKKVMECTARLRNRILSDSRSRICPDAYASTDTTNLVQPAASSLTGILIVFIGLLVVLIVTNIYLYKWSFAGLIDALHRIVPES